MREDNELIPVSMQIILNAGDARTDAFNAIAKAREGSFEEADALLVKAEEEIKQAHIAQTEVMQNEISGTEYELFILFIHAQDTLMTIKTELSLAKEMVQMYREINELKKG